MRLSIVNLVRLAWPAKPLQANGWAARTTMPLPFELSPDEVTGLKEWFTSYVQTFRTGDIQIQRNMDLKAGHTRRVCREIVALGKKLGLRDSALRLAEIIALLHDIGRFEQYTKYRTFRDGKSENHAELGIRVLERFGILKPLGNKAEGLILCAICHHNEPSLSRVENADCLFFSRLLRDADKLDIWRVVTEYYHRKSGERNGALELELPDTPGFSKECGRDLMKKGIVDIQHVKSLNDYKLLQIGWIFDVNFEPTLHCIKRRRYLEMIWDVLPGTEEIKEIFDAVHAFLHARVPSSR
jgi:hypothetical protein